MAPPEIVSTAPFPPVPSRKETGVLFMPDMSLAIREDRKTQTRRRIAIPKRGAFVLRGDDEHADGGPWWPYQSDDGESDVCDDGCEHRMNCPYGQPGDLIWGREAFAAFGRWETRYSAEKGRDEWHFVDMTLETGRAYRYERVQLPPRRSALAKPTWHNRPSLFMPRVASRITLEITAVRVERLHDISEADCRAEGCAPQAWCLEDSEGLIDWPLKDAAHPYRNGYALLWEQINCPGTWAANPWVWAITFKRINP